MCKTIDLCRPYHFSYWSLFETDYLGIWKPISLNCPSKLIRHLVRHENSSLIELPFVLRCVTLLLHISRHTSSAFRIRKCTPGLHDSSEPPACLSSTENPSRGLSGTSLLIALLVTPGDYPQMSNDTGSHRQGGCGGHWQGQTACPERAVPEAELKAHSQQLD